MLYSQSISACLSVDRRLYKNYVNFVYAKWMMEQQSGVWPTADARAELGRDYWNYNYKLSILIIVYRTRSLLKRGFCYEYIIIMLEINIPFKAYSCM